MKGLLAQGMAEGGPEGGAEPSSEQNAEMGDSSAMEGGKAKYRTKAVEAIPPNLRDAFERVVLAGMKVMYSPETEELVSEAMNAPGEVWKKLGEGVAGLMMLLDKQSGKGIPQDVIIPAAIELVSEAADHMNQTGQAVSPDDLKTATQYAAILIAKKFGANDEQITGMFGGQQSGGQQDAQVPQSAAPMPEQGA